MGTPRRARPVRDGRATPTSVLSAESDRGSARTTPYAILVTIQVFEAVVLLLFAAFPSRPDARRSVDLAIAGVLLLACLVVWFAAPRMPRDNGLDVAIVFNSVLAAGVTVAMLTAVGQLATGFVFVLLGTFTAYFRPTSHLMPHLVVMLGLYAGALLVNPILPPLYFAFTVGIVLGVALLVSTMAERLRNLALHDSLTGLLNRRGLDLTARPVADLAARTGSPVTVGLIDLDNFKGYNDEHGHLAGDQLLVDVTDAWCQELRDSDLLARYGGDEFAVILPGATIGAVVDLTARVRAHHGSTWSVGFAEWDPREELYSALGRADHNLYAAKRARASATITPRRADTGEPPDSAPTKPSQEPG
jgi:diguanylate cyclase (GGDEF)-like protein